MYFSLLSSFVSFFFYYTATPQIYPYCHTLSLHDALPIYQALQANNYYLAIPRAQAAAAAGYKPDAVNVTLAQAYFGKAGTANSSVEPQRGLNQQGQIGRASCRERVCQYV